MAKESLVIQVSEKGTLVVKRNLDNLGKSAQKAGGGVKLLRTALGGIATIGIGAVLVSAVRTMASFSQEMSTVAAVTRASGDTFDELTMKARELGATTRFSATQAAEGMTFLARAGFSTNEVLSAIGPTLKLAQAGGLGLGRAADIASNVLTGFNIQATEAARVIDVLALAANSANTNVDQLGEAMSYVAPIAKVLNVSLEETTAGVQTLSDAGIQASRAGTNLTMVMRLMTAATPKQTKVLQELGLTTKDIDVSSKGLTGALKTMADAGITTEQMFRYFGRSAAAAGVLIEGTTGKLQQYTTANEGAQGAAETMAKVMDDNLNGALLAVRSAWEELQLAFGDLGPQSGLTKALKGLATALRTIAANMEVATTAVAALAASIAALKWAPFLQGMLSATTAMGGLSGAIGVVQGALAGLALNPITIGIIALSAAVVALTAAFNKYKKLQDEIEAQEEKIYKMKLARLQAQVKEIKDRKAADAALKDYIKSLDQENKFLALGEAAQDESVKLTRAMEIAKRKLTDEEVASIQAKLDERAAIEQANDLKKKELELLQSIKKPQQEYSTQEMLLNNLRNAGKISQEEYNNTLDQLKEKYGQTGTESAKYLESLQQEVELLKLNTQERAARKAIMDAESAKGSELTKDEADAVKALIAERDKLKAQDYISQLKSEHELLGKSREEREKLLAIKQAELAAGAPLSEEQKSDVLRMREENMELERQAALLEAIKGPQLEYNNNKAALGQLLADNKITLEEYRKELKNLDESMQTTTTNTAATMDDVWSGVWNNAGRALDEFAKGGIITFKGFANSVIQDLQRIIQKQILISAFKAIGIPIPGFATGGSFTIGGSGGTDSQMVAFKGTPGERVDVLTPGQQRQQAAGTAEPPVINIINVTDPSEIPAAMASSEGEQVIINTLTRNRDSVRQAIS